jgi:Uma2 family endonuclease
MPVAPEYFTAEMVRALPDDGLRHEVVFGEHLVTPSPSWPHQGAVAVLVQRLMNYCDRFACGRVFTSPSDISWSDDTLVQPDVFVIAPQEAYAGAWSKVRTLTLVAEVLSPSTARNDRFQKRRLYQSQGVGTLWLVDTERRLVEVWAPDATFPVIETEQLSWQPSEATVALTIPLADLFR